MHDVQSVKREGVRDVDWDDLFDDRGWRIRTTLTILISVLSMIISCIAVLGR